MLAKNIHHSKQGEERHVGM